MQRDVEEVGGLRMTAVKFERAIGCVCLVCVGLWWTEEGSVEHERGLPFFFNYY